MSNSPIHLLLLLLLLRPCQGWAENLTVQVPRVEVRRGSIFLSHETLHILQTRYFLSATDKFSQFNTNRSIPLTNNERRPVNVVARQVNVDIPDHWSEFAFVYSTDKGNRFRLFVPEATKPFRIKGGPADDRLSIINEKTVVLNDGIIIRGAPIEIGVGVCEKEFELINKAWKANKAKIIQDQIAYLELKSSLLKLDSALELEISDSIGELAELGQVLHAANSRSNMLLEVATNLNLGADEQASMKALQDSIKTEIEETTSRAQELNDLKNTATTLRTSINNLLSQIAVLRSEKVNELRNRVVKEVEARLQE